MALREIRVCSGAPWLSECQDACEKGLGLGQVQLPIYFLLLHTTQAELRTKASEENPVRLYPVRRFSLCNLRKWHAVVQLQPETMARISARTIRLSFFNQSDAIA